MSYRLLKKQHLVLLTDVALTEIALLAADGLRHRLPFGLAIEPDTRYLTPTVALAVAAIWIAVFQLWGVYQTRQAHPSFAYTLKTVGLAITFACFTLASFFYFLKIQNFSRVLFLYFYLLDLLLLLSFRVAHSLFWGRSYQDARRLLIIGGGLRPELLDQIARWPDYELIGILGPADLPSTVPILGPVSLANEVIQQQTIDEVILTPAAWERGDVASLALNLREQPVRIRVAPDILEIVTRAPVGETQGLPLIDVRAPAIGGFQRAVKRGFDILIAALGLLITAPPMGLIAIAIKLDSDGPVLFVQERAGQYGEPFKMYKFRSMVAGAEELLDQFIDVESLDEPAFKLRGDPRVTHVGHILRRTSLDELPQLFNVLKGEMSLVGPRPEEVRLVQQYDTWQRQRLRVRPGMTGAMQVSGRADLPLRERVKLEVAYIENYSLWVDIKILLKTIPAILRGKGAY